MTVAGVPSPLKPYVSTRSVPLAVNVSREKWCIVSSRDAVQNGGGNVWNFEKLSTPLLLLSFPAGLTLIHVTPSDSSYPLRLELVRVMLLDTPLSGYVRS